MNHSYQDIEVLIESVRGKKRRVNILRACLVATALIVGTVGVAVLVLPALEGWSRLIIRAALSGTLIGALINWLLTVFLAREDLEETALAIEQVNPWLKNALINSVQLERMASMSGPSGAFSPALLEKHLDTTAAVLPELDLEKATPTQALKKPALIAALVSIIFLLLIALAPARTGQGLAAMFNEPWSLPEKDTNIAALPLTTGDFNLHYTFPEYSGIGPQSVEHTNGDMAALKGTAVKIETQVLEPLKSASLVTSNGARYAMEINDGTGLKAELILSDPGTYYIEGRGEDGEKWAEPKSHRIVVDEDLHPEAVMLTPVDDVEVAAEGTLNVSYETSDDFGIRQIALGYQQDGEDKKIPIAAEKENGVKRLRGHYEWIISEMDFRPGDRIPFYIEVLDNDEVAGGKLGRSEMRVLEIFSARKHHRQLLARQDEFMNRMIDHLAGHIMAWIKEGKGKLDLVESEKHLIEEGRQMVSVLEVLLLELREDEFAEVLVVDTFADMAVRYPELLDDREKTIARYEKDKARWKDDVHALIDEYRSGLENDILYLDKLIKKQRMDDLLAEAGDLYKAQADLADLLAEYKRTGNPDLLEKLRQTIEDLQDAFESLARRMAEMRKSLPEEFINADALDKANMGDLASEMEKLRQALADGDMEAALAMAEEFLSSMGMWMSALEDSADSMGMTMSGEMMEKLSEIGDQLDDMIARQKEVEDGLQDIYNSALEQTDGSNKLLETKKDIDESLQQFKREMARVKNSFLRLQPGAMEGKPRPMTRIEHQTRRALADPYSRMGKKADDAKQDLSEGNLEGAMDRLQEIKDQLDNTRKQCSGFADKNKSGPSGRRANFESGSDRAEELLDQAMEGMKSLKDSLSGSLSARERSLLDELSWMEDALRSDVESTMEQYEELREEAASLPGEVSERLEEAGEKLGECSGGMGAGKPGQSMVPARDARKNMEQAKGSLNQAMQQMMQSMMMGSGMSGMPKSGQSDKPGSEGQCGWPGDAEIPDEDLYSVPEEFREQLLKAMQEDSPEAYKNLNKDYYERLVR